MLVSRTTLKPPGLLRSAARDHFISHPEGTCAGGAVSLKGLEHPGFPVGSIDAEHLTIEFTPITSLVSRYGSMSPALERSIHRYRDLSVGLLEDVDIQIACRRELAVAEQLRHGPQGNAGSGESRCCAVPKAVKADPRKSQFFKPALKALGDGRALLGGPTWCPKHQIAQLL